MPWVRQRLSHGRFAYVAPVEASPVTKVIFDPRTNQPKWTIEYAWLMPGIDTIAVIEAIMELESGLS